jgi:hypothetical protein
VHLGPRQRPRLRFRRIRPLVSRRRAVLFLLLVFSFMTTAGLMTAGRFTSGPVTVGVDQAVTVALSPALALETFSTSVPLHVRGSHVLC